MYRLTVSDIENILNLYTDEYVQKLKEEVDKIPKEDRTIELVPVSKKTIKTMLNYVDDHGHVKVDDNGDTEHVHKYLDKLKLYRIRAKRNLLINDNLFIPAGELGGIVSGYNNVPITATNVWVDYDSMVIGKAKAVAPPPLYGMERTLIQCSKIYDNAKVSARIVGSTVYQNARVYCGVVERSNISGNVLIINPRAGILDSRIEDHAKILCSYINRYNTFNGTYIYSSIIGGNSVIYGHGINITDSRIRGKSRINSNCGIYSKILVSFKTYNPKDKNRNLSLTFDLMTQLDLIPIKDKDNGDYVIAYKAINHDKTSVFDKDFKYDLTPGAIVECVRYDNDHTAACSNGLHFTNMKLVMNFINEMMDIYSTQDLNDTPYIVTAKIQLDDIISVVGGKIRCKKATIISASKLDKDMYCNILSDFKTGSIPLPNKHGVLTIPKNVDEDHPMMYTHILRSLWPKEVKFEEPSRMKKIDRLCPMLRDNKNLRKITLPKNLEVIDDFAFSECTKLESIVIPKNVHTIGMRAFDKCYHLKTIVFEGNIPIKISKSAFKNVPIHLLEIYSAADDMSIHVPNMCAGIIEPKPISEYYNRKESKENE